MFKGRKGGGGGEVFGCALKLNRKSFGVSTKADQLDLLADRQTVSWA